MKFGGLKPAAKFILQDENLSVYSSMPAFMKLGIVIQGEKGSTQVITTHDGMPFYGITDDTDVVELGI